MMGNVCGDSIGKIVVVYGGFSPSAGGVWYYMNFERGASLICVKANVDYTNCKALDALE